MYIIILCTIGNFTVQELGQNKPSTKLAIVKIHGKEVDRFEIDKIDHLEKLTILQRDNIIS